MVELLTPAGDFERLKFAFLYGADAVYCGGRKFGLRANAKNFSLDELKEATLYAHSLNKKIYITVNIVFHDKDIEGLDDYLKYLDSIKVDGIICSDILVVKKVKELGLNLHISLSTQASTLNKRQVKFWSSLGVNRVVLAREASREDVKSIKSTGIEVETFIHGAMCVSFSGKCVLSNYMTLRDSNRGGCAQICRWPFDIGLDHEFEIMPKDLNMIPFIKELMDIGVDSFKIEGRMRSIYYVSTVINCYRAMIDLAYEDKLTSGIEAYYLNILNRCANRESTPQFFDEIPSENEQYYNGREEISNQDFLGLVLGYDDNKKMVKLEVRNYFESGYIAEFFGPDMEPVEIKINNILNEDFEIIGCANHPKSVVYLSIDKKIPENAMLRIKAFDKNDFL